MYWGIKRYKHGWMDGWMDDEQQHMYTSRNCYIQYRLQYTNLI